MPKKKSTKEERSKKRHQKSSRVAKQASRVAALMSRVPRAKAMLGSLLTKKKTKKKRGFQIKLELAGAGRPLGTIPVPSVNVGLKTIQQRCIAALKRDPDYRYKGPIFLRKGHGGGVLKSLKNWPKDEVIVVQHFIPLTDTEKQSVKKKRGMLTEKEWKRYIQRRFMYDKNNPDFPLQKQGGYYLAALDAGIKVYAHSSAEIKALRPNVTLTERSLQKFLERYHRYKRLHLIATSQYLIHVDV